MRYHVPVHLNAPAAWFGERTESVGEAVAAGRVDRDLAAQDGYSRLTVSGLSPGEMAVRAAGQSLLSANVAGTEIDQLLHAYTYHQGHEFWSCAHYIAAELGATAAVPIGIQQMCNGGAAAIEIAARGLLGDAGMRAALVTTADRFEQPGFDRWSGDSGASYGDAATAVVLARTRQAPGARLMASATSVAAEMEGMHRGTEPFSVAPRSGLSALQPWRTKKQFRDSTPGLDVAKAIQVAVSDVVTEVLAEAAVDPADPRLRAVALPRMSLPVVAAYAAGSREACAAPTFGLGRDTGHLGAGDAAANLADIVGHGLVEPGGMAVLLSVGGGFTWTAMLVEIHE